MPGRPGAPGSPDVPLKPNGSVDPEGPGCPGGPDVPGLPGSPLGPSIPDFPFKPNKKEGADVYSLVNREVLAHQTIFQCKDLAQELPQMTLSSLTSSIARNVTICYTYSWNYYRKKMDCNHIRKFPPPKRHRIECHFSSLINPARFMHAFYTHIRAKTAVTIKAFCTLLSKGPRRVTVGSWKARVSRKSLVPWQSL